MSNGSGTQDQITCGTPLRTDSLADSVLILVAIMVVQRLVGFCRAILFCRWLDAGQLGRWDMAFSFLMLAGPVAVLALSSSFRRYVEYYRHRGQLRTFIRRTIAGCVVLALAAVFCIHLGQRWFSQLIFGTPGQAGLVSLLATALVAVIAFNTLFDLFTALRNARVAAGLQLVNTLVFAASGIALLRFWQCTAESVVIGYGAACAVSSAAGGAWLVCRWKSLPQDHRPPPHRELWSKLIPFAAWIWLASMLANLFAVADRYMILHYSPLPSSEALAQVGQYHSSRVVPLLMVAVAGVLSALITPHLSHDWESGRRERVVARLSLFLKLFAFALSSAAALILLGAPLLFGVAFLGKFAGGEAVLPWALTYCVWFAVFLIAQNYLLCREKAYLASLALAAGLVVNVGLNLLLLPRLQLLGAVLATTAANLIALVILGAVNHRLGFRIDRGTCLVLAVPLVFWLGPWATLACLVLIVLRAHHSNWILSADEKRQIGEALAAYRQRFRSEKGVRTLFWED